MTSSLIVWGCWLIPRAFTFRRDGLTPFTEGVVFDYFPTSLRAKGGGGLCKAEGYMGKFSGSTTGTLTSQLLSHSLAENLWGTASYHSDLPPSPTGSDGGGLDISRSQSQAGV